MQIPISGPERDYRVIARHIDEDPTYRYVLVADSRVIVEKLTGSGWVPSYEVDDLGSCDCPGYTYRESCKHIVIARDLRARVAQQ